MSAPTVQEVLGRVALVRDEAVLAELVEVLDRYVAREYGPPAETGQAQREWWHGGRWRP